MINIHEFHPIKEYVLIRDSVEQRELKKTNTSYTNFGRQTMEN